MKRKTDRLPLRPFQEHILVLTDKALDELAYSLKHSPDFDAEELLGVLRQYTDLLGRAVAEGDNVSKRHFAATIVATAIRLSQPVHEDEGEHYI